MVTRTDADCKATHTTSPASFLGPGEFSSCLLLLTLFFGLVCHGFFLWDRNKIKRRLKSFAFTFFLVKLKVGKDNLCAYMCTSNMCMHIKHTSVNLYYFLPNFTLSLST